MATDFIVVSFYTEGTPYEREARLLAKSCDRFGVKHDIQPRANLRDWTLNTMQKCRFMVEMLDKHGADNRVVWVDVDARFKRWPLELEEIKADCSAYHVPGITLRSGTMLFREGPGAREILRRWQQVLDAREPGCLRYEQVDLRTVIEAGGPWTFAKLPVQLCWIYDADPRYEAEADDPCIVHYQASRRYRSAVA